MQFNFICQLKLILHCQLGNIHKNIYNQKILYNRGKILVAIPYLTHLLKINVIVLVYIPFYNFLKLHASVLAALHFQYDVYAETYLPVGFLLHHISH